MGEKSRLTAFYHQDNNRVAEGGTRDPIVQILVSNGHGEAQYIVFRDALKLQELIDALQKMQGLLPTGSGEDHRVDFRGDADPSY